MCCTLSARTLFSLLYTLALRQITWHTADPDADPDPCNHISDPSDSLLRADEQPYVLTEDNGAGPRVGARQEWDRTPLIADPPGLPFGLSAGQGPAGAEAVVSAAGGLGPRLSLRHGACQWDPHPVARPVARALSPALERCGWVCR